MFFSLSLLTDNNLLVYTDHVVLGSADYRRLQELENLMCVDYQWEYDDAPMRTRLLLLCFGVWNFIDWCVIPSEHFDEHQWDFRHYWFQIKSNLVIANQSGSTAAITWWSTGELSLDWRSNMSTFGRSGDEQIRNII